MEVLEFLVIRIIPAGIVNDCNCQQGGRYIIRLRAATYYSFVPSWDETKSLLMFSGGVIGENGDRRSSSLPIHLQQR